MLRCPVRTAIIRVSPRRFGALAGGFGGVIFAGEYRLSDQQLPGIPCHRFGCQPVPFMPTLLPRLCNVSCETLARGRPSRWCRGDGGRIARNWRCGEIAGVGDSDNRAQYPYWGGFGDVSHETSGRFRAVIAVTYNQGNASAQPRRAGPALNPHGHNQPGGALVVGLFDDANPIVALQV